MLANLRLARDSLDVGGAALEDYEVLDVSASFAVTERLEVHGRVQNAADEAYQEVLGYHTAGRAAYAGVRMRF